MLEDLIKSLENRLLFYFFSLFRIDSVDSSLVRRINEINLGINGINAIIIRI